jgi:hypothetical protein
MKHARHINARYHFICEYIIDGTITIIFVGTKDNKADIFTKNVTSETFEEHIYDYIAHHEIIKTTTEPLKKYTFFDSGGVLESVVPIKEWHIGINNCNINNLKSGLNSKNMDDSSEGSTKERNKQKCIDNTNKDKYNINESEGNVFSMKHHNYDYARKRIDWDSHPSQPETDPKT